MPGPSLEHVIEFLAELFVARTNTAAAAIAAASFNHAAAELTAEGRPVRLVRSIFVPNDETCFLLVEGTTGEDVREAARRAQLTFDHVGEAVH